MENPNLDWLIPGRMVMLTRTIHRSSWCVGTRTMKDLSYQITQPVQFIRITGYGQAQVAVKTLTDVEKRLVSVSQLSPCAEVRNENGDPAPSFEPMFSKE